MRDDAGEDAGDDADDATWLTYGQLAERRGISRRAAVRLTQRHRWRRQAGNDTFARVLVPNDFLSPVERARDVTPAVAEPRADDDAGDDSRDDAGAVALLRDALTTLRQQLEHERRRGDDVARVRDRTIASLRDAEAALSETRAEADLARAHTQQAAQALEASRQVADQAVADRRTAEVRAETAMARADGLRDQVEELRIKLAELEAEGHAQTVEAADLSARAKAAETAQAEAQAHAAELRQADKERRAGGRWARLRAAWRGE
jgi:hypothetical protein